MPKKPVILLLIFCVSIDSFAQKEDIRKVQLSFSWFKSYDTEFTIDYNTNQFSVVRFDILKKEAFRKTYKFSNSDFEKFKKILEENAPDSEVQKSTSALDGGGFALTYYFDDGKSTKITVRNPYRKNPKYDSEFKIIDTFFDFAYSVVKDEQGIFTLDNTYEPYFDGIPIRKISDNPIEYKLWGNVSGNASTNTKFIDFLNSLPKSECVVIDTDGKLSWALQNDILVRYIIQNSNIGFANMSYLKYTREYILEIRPEIQAAKNSNENMDKFKRKSSAITYLADPERMDKWLELNNWNKSIEEIRENCR